MTKKQKPKATVHFFLQIPALPFKDKESMLIEETPSPFGRQVKPEDYVLASDEQMFRLIFGFHNNAVEADMSWLHGTMSAINFAFPEIKIKSDESQGFDAKNNLMVLEAGIDTAYPNPDQDELTLLFDHAMNMLNMLIESVSAVLQEPIERISLGSIQPFVPYVVNIGNHHSVKRGIFLTNSNWNRLGSFSDHVLTEQDREGVAQGIERIHAGVFDTFISTRREAWCARSRGDIISETIMVAASSEVLLKDIIFMLMWEEGLEPEDAWSSQYYPNQKHKGIVTFVRDELASRFGQEFDPNAQDSIAGHWKVNIADARNNFMHLGKRPDNSAMGRLRETFMNLENSLGNALCSDQLIRRYPITAWTFCGTEGLKRRGAGARLSDITNDPFILSPDNPVLLFGRWKDEMVWCSNAEARVVSPEYCYMYYVHYPSHKHAWFVVDENVDLACRINEPVMAESKQRTLRELTKDLLAQNLESPISVKIDDHPVNLDGLVDWRPLYESLPMHEIHRWPRSLAYVSVP